MTATNNNSKGNFSKNNTSANNGWWKDDKGTWHQAGETASNSTANLNSTFNSAGKSNYGDTWGAWKDSYYNCHTGNTAIFTIGKGTLYAGGWMRGVKPEAGWVIIDLAGHYDTISSSCSGFERAIDAANKRFSNQVFSFYIKDFGTPDQKQDFWVALASDVKDLLSSGKSILVACEGGHGRTGMVLAILVHLLGQSNGEDPINYIRALYCENAVETVGQEKYVYEMCGLAVPVHNKSNQYAKHCCYCGVTLIEKFGDDMEAEVCSTCIEDYHMTRADLDKLSNGAKDQVKKELEEAVAKIDDDVVVGQCVYCGQNIYLTADPKDQVDDLDHEICGDCVSWLKKQNVPLY